MNKKVESLMKLREVVEQQAELGFNQYITCNGDNCVIGHLLKVGGVTNEQLKKIDNGEYKIDGDDVAAYSIYTILEKSQYHHIYGNFVKDAVEKLGFDISKDKHMLNELQKLNDNYRGKKEVIIEKIDYYINNLQKEAV